MKKALLVAAVVGLLLGLVVAGAIYAVDYALSHFWVGL